MAALPIGAKLATITTMNNNSKKNKTSKVKNKWADWGLAIGILIGWLGLPVSIVGLIKSKKTGVGAGVAKVGIIVSIITITISALLIINSNREHDKAVEQVIEELNQQTEQE